MRSVYLKEEKKMKTMGVIQFANKHSIKWFPINLRINQNGKKELLPIGSCMPKMTDFALLSTEELLERQTSINKYNYIALDTSEFYQLDFDTTDHPIEMEKLTQVCPYFESSTKCLPHCFIKSNTTARQKRYMTKWQGIELLSGQWSYCPKNAHIHNSEKDIPEFSVDSIVHQVHDKEHKVSSVRPNNTIDFNTLSTVVSSLSPARCDNYDDWLTIVFAIIKTGRENNFSLQAESLVHSWSKSNPKYDVTYLNALIHRHFNSERSPTFGTLCHMLKQDNIEQFNELITTCEKEIEHSDFSACEAFEQFNKENGYEYIRTNTDVYWYHKETGLWQKGLDGIRALLVTCYTLGKYRVSAKLQSSMLLIFKDRIRKEQDFFLKAYNSTKKKIAFDNGIYDFAQKKLIPFDSKYVFFYKMKWAYTTEINQNVVNEIKQKIFYDVFDKTRGDYYIDILSRAVAGECEDKVFNIVIGDGNSGKGVNSAINENAFGEYCKTFNAESLQITSGTGDQAKHRSWMVALQFARIAIANEVTMSTALDGNKIKTFSGGGDTIMARVNHKDETNFKLQCTPIYFVNDMPKIKPMLQELKNRLKYMETQYSYLSGVLYEQQKNCPNVKIADPLIKSKFCTDEEVLRTYAIMICQNYKDLPPEPPEEVIKSIEEWTDADDAKSKISELFQATEDENDTISSREVITFVKELGLDISDTKIGKEMTKLGFRKKLIKKNKKPIQMYLNIKVNQNEEDSDL
jgi:hypothetical protein